MLITNHPGFWRGASDLAGQRIGKCVNQKIKTELLSDSDT